MAFKAPWSNEKRKKKGGRPRVNQGTCSDPGCDQPATVKGMCRLHYDRWWKKRKFGTCSEPGCDNPARDSGLCTIHNKYNRHRVDQYMTVDRMHEAYKNASSVSSRMFWKKLIKEQEVVSE